jgi:hypothetical protein
MKRLTGGLIAAALAVSFMGSPLAAQPKSDADVMRETRDREEIQHLAWRYARALDTFNAESYASLFTQDGSFGATKGRDALFKMIDAFRKPAANAPAGTAATPPKLLHMETNHWIEFKNRDTAIFHYYWITIGQPAKQGDPTRVLAAGNGIDEIVRVDGKWLFKSRQVVAPND